MLLSDEVGRRLLFGVGIAIFLNPGHRRPLDWLGDERTVPGDVVAVCTTLEPGSAATARARVTAGNSYPDV